MAFDVDEAMLSLPLTCGELSQGAIGAAPCIDWQSPKVYIEDQFDFSSVTSITFISPLLNPTKSLFPRVFQAIEVT